MSAGRDRGALRASELERYMPTDADMLPCPFCGGQPYATRTVNGTQMFKVGCASCGLELKAAWYRDAEKPTKDILALWNTRAALGGVGAAGKDKQNDERE